MREELANLCHEQWSGWMKYLFSKMSEDKSNLGPYLFMPKWAEDRWKRQMNTAYKDLSEEEKESDRKEAGS